MPNLEISNLPAVTTPAGADVLAVSQGAVTRKISLTQILADATLPGSFTKVTLPLGGTAAAPLLAFGDGDSGIWQETDDELSFGVLGVERFTLDVAQGFHAFLATGPAILNETPSATNPVFVPRRDSPTTGLGAPAADELSLIIGGAEHERLTAAVHQFNVANLVLNAVNVFSALTTGSVGLSGGSTAALGGNIVIYGEAHATQADDLELRASGATKLQWDDSLDRWIMTGEFLLNGNLGFFNTAPTAQNTGWATFTNLSTDKTCDADTVAVAELADIVGTLIEELKAKGLVGA